MSVRIRLPNDDAEWLRLRAARWPDLSTEIHRGEMSAHARGYTTKTRVPEF